MVYNWHNGFEYDPEKSRSNKLKHGIDFEEAQELWQTPYFEYSLETKFEKRWAVIGFIFDNFWTAIITKRSNNIRIISVRRSRYEEKQIYQERFKKED